MSELSSGNSEILKAIAVLSEVTDKVKAGSHEIQAETEDIDGSMQGLKEISIHVLKGINEIASRSAEIDKVIMEVAERSKENSDSIVKLIDEINKFKTA